jgi:hypothetical protein
MAAAERTANITARTVVVLVVINLLLWVNAPEGISNRTLLASVMLWVSAYPTWRYFNQRESNIPFMPAMAVVYFAFYGLPAYRERAMVGTSPIPDEHVEAALLLALVGEALMLLAFYATANPGRRAERFRFELDLYRCRFRVLLFAFFFAAMRGFYALHDPPALVAQLLQVLMTLPVLLTGGLFLLHLRGQLPRQYGVLTLLLVLALIFMDLAAGTLARPMLTMAAYGMLYVVERRRIPFVPVALAIAFILPFHMMKSQFRRETWGRSDLGVFDRSAIYLKLVGDRVTNDSDARESRQQLEQVRGRFDHLAMFSHVVAKTPDEIPYWEGETYKDLLWTFVPRLLVPDKPHKLLGLTYGHRYRITSSHDTQTSINLEQTVEMYANFGVLGVVVGMFALGLLYRLLYAALNSERSGDGGRLIAVQTFSTLMAIESDFSLVFGALVQSALVLYLALRAVAPVKKSPEEAPNQDSNLATIGAN